MRKFARLFRGTSAGGVAELTVRSKDPCLQYAFLWANSSIDVNLNALKSEKFGKLRSS